jgi:surface polysaccharide O-acyltransferase-like enzyme
MSHRTILLFVAVLFASSLSAEEHHYLSAADLEVECSKKSETCYGVIYGVLGSLLYLNNTEQMKEVLCLPAISAEDIRLHFLSYAIDNRKGVIVASVIC